MVKNFQEKGEVIFRTFNEGSYDARGGGRILIKYVNYYQGISSFSSACVMQEERPTNYHITRHGWSLNDGCPGI